MNTVLSGKPRSRPLAVSWACLPAPDPQRGVYKEVTIASASLNSKSHSPFYKNIASWLAQRMGTEATQFVVPTQPLIKRCNLEPTSSAQGLVFFTGEGSIKAWV